jgi:hypothetical protein
MLLSSPPADEDPMPTCSHGSVASPSMRTTSLRSASFALLTLVLPFRGRNEIGCRSVGGALCPFPCLSQARSVHAGWWCRVVVTDAARSALDDESMTKQLARSSSSPDAYYRDGGTADASSAAAVDLTRCERLPLDHPAVAYTAGSSSLSAPASDRGDSEQCGHLSSSARSSSSSESHLPCSSKRSHDANSFLQFLHSWQLLIRRFGFARRAYACVVADDDVPAASH